MKLITENKLRKEIREILLLEAKPNRNSGNGFIPRTKNKKFNIILIYKRYPKEKYDIVLEPKDYRNEQSFLNAVLEEIPIFKLPYLAEMNVLQYFTSKDSQLPPYIRQKRGKFYFNK